MTSSEDQNLIKTFVANKPLMEAVHRVMVSKIYEQGGVETYNTNFVFALNQTEDDSVFGRKVKVIVQAMVELEKAFKDMVLAAEPQAEPITENEAR
jgi:hypothetical protein